MYYKKTNYLLLSTIFINYFFCASVSLPEINNPELYKCYSFKKDLISWNDVISSVEN